MVVLDLWLVLGRGLIWCGYEFFYYSGPSKNAQAYLNWLREDKRFSDIFVQISPSELGHSFPKLKLWSRWPAKLSFKLITQLLLFSFGG
ncbi:hypothetical protein RIF29_15093 [Crotalaria pallida]|uniref:Uncharacterized protein n=1 Tax=Crotalaria pallida TaxID=3830 RepID=A0AAN9FL92_CROPI